MKEKNSQSQLVYLVIAAVVAIVVLILIAGLYFSSLNQSSNGITGYLVTLNNSPVVNASVIIDDQIVDSTDENGYFSISPEVALNNTIKFDAEGFVEKNIKLGDTVDNILLIEIIPESTTILTGKFITDEEFDFTNEKININGKNYTLDPDGGFRISDLPVGTVTFEYNSLYFDEISREINVKEGLNSIKDYTLSPSGEVVGKLESYIVESKVENLTIQADRVKPEQVLIDLDSDIFTIKDLKIGDEYLIRVTSQGFETRNYTIVIEQGENILFGFKLVEEGSAVYYGKNGETKDSLVYVSDFDGTDLTSFSEIVQYNPSNLYYSKESNTVYFTSNTENLKNNSGQRVSVVYKLDLNTKNITQITLDTSLVSTISPNYSANRLISVPVSTRNPESVKVLDLQGNLISDLGIFENLSIETALITELGNKVYLDAVNSEDMHKLIEVTVNTKAQRELGSFSKLNIYDISEDGHRIVFSGPNSSENFVDLMMYDSSTMETRNLLVDFRGFDVAFVKGSDSRVLYIDNVNSRTNIFAFDIDLNADTRITELTANDELSAFFQQGDLIFYITDKGLYVLDLQNPVSYKLVITGKYGDLYKD